MDTETPELKISALPVYDKFLSKWRILIVRREGENQTALLDAKLHKRKAQAEDYARLLLSVMQMELQTQGATVTREGAGNDDV